MVRHPGLLLLLLLLTSSPPPSRPSPPPPPAGGRGELVMQKRLPGATAAAAAGAEEDEEDGGGGTTAGGGTEGGGTLEKYSGVKVRISFTRGGETMSLKQLSGGPRTLVALALIFAIQVGRRGGGDARLWPWTSAACLASRSGGTGDALALLSPSLTLSPSAPDATRYPCPHFAHAPSLPLPLQRCDPAPFYLFDEIDAALDPQVREGVLFANKCPTLLSVRILQQCNREYGHPLPPSCTNVPQYRTTVSKMLRRQADESRNPAQFIVTTFHPQVRAAWRADGKGRQGYQFISAKRHHIPRSGVRPPRSVHPPTPV